jgi:hypothetical protein
MALASVTTKESAATLPSLKAALPPRPAPQGHWVGDGFPVRSIFTYENAGETTPFLLLDYAGPQYFSLQ